MKLFQVGQKAEKKKQVDNSSIPAMMFSLEPRIMFDAAALATGMDVLDHTLTDGPEAFMAAMVPTDPVENQVFVDENEALVMAISPEDNEVYISGGADQNMFEVNSDAEELMFKGPPDFENPGDKDGNNEYHVELTFPTQPGIDVKTYTVIVKDVFEPGLTIEVPENQTIVTEVHLAEPGTEGEYVITGGADQNLFSINEDSGALRFKNAPDYEAPDDLDGDNVYEVRVSFSGPGYGPGDETPVDIAVTVLDVNESSPIITTGSVDVNENQSFVTTITSTGPNPDDMTYSISGGADQDLFAIDSSTGELTFKQAPDFEIPGNEAGDNVYDIQVTVSNGSLSDTKNLLVTVQDVNDAPLYPDTAMTIDENSSVGTIVGTASATDPEGGSLSYAIIDGNLKNAFAVDANGQIRVNNSAALDFETTPTFTLTLQVTEEGGHLTDTATVTITLTNMNDTPVVNPIPDQIHIGEKEWVFKVPDGTFTDPDGDPLACSVSGLPDWMSFDPQTKTFRGTPDRSMDGQSYNLTVNVDDGQGGTASDAFRLTLRMVVAGPPPLSYYVPIIGDGVGGESNSGGSDIGNVTDINGTAGNLGTSPSGGSGYDTGIFVNTESNPGEIYIAGGTGGSYSPTNDPSTGLNTGTPAGETGTPGETAAPESGTPPGETGTPGETAAPESGTPPGETGTPGETAAPESGTPPGETGTPGETAAPESGTPPGETGTPGETAAPESGTPPGETGTPGETSHPGTGDGEGSTSNEPDGSASGGHESTEKTPSASKGKLSFFDQCKKQKSPSA